MASGEARIGQRYVLIEPIAHGGMATVYRARDEVLARTVAVKVLSGSLAEDETFIARFKREALAAARLAHPNIVAIYDTGTEQDGHTTRHYIVMEHCGGGTLRDLLEREGPLDPDRVRAIGAAICDALGHAHSHGIVHRDIKPANILFTDDGTLKVADFGIARAVSETSRITQSGAVVGTAVYLSPEQARSEEPDERSDIYSLGVMLYELLCGRPPFSADSQVATALQHINEAPPPPRSLRAGVPRALEEAVLRALEKDPARRFQDAGAFKAALLGGHAPAQPEVAPAVPAPRPAPAEREHLGIGETVRSLAPVIALIAAAVAVVIFLPRLFDGGAARRGGGDGRGGGGSPAAIAVREVRDFDPHGGGEHPEEVPLAIDDDPNTAWSTENYTSPLQALKPGVGLLFDLGDSVAVGTIEVVSPAPGYSFELRAADQAGADETAFEVVAAVEGASSSERVETAGRRARFWLLWITSLPGGGGGRAEIAEVRFVGP